MTPAEQQLHGIAESIMTHDGQQTARPIDPNHATLRDQFAMAAIIGICVNFHLLSDRQELLACSAYEVADAMLKERAK
jgi:hypothetical protein